MRHLRKISEKQHALCILIYKIRDEPFYFPSTFAIIRKSVTSNSSARILRYLLNQTRTSHVRCNVRLRVLAALSERKRCPKCVGRKKERLHAKKRSNFDGQVLRNRSLSLSLSIRQITGIITNPLRGLSFLFGWIGRARGISMSARTARF